MQSAPTEPGSLCPANARCPQHYCYWGALEGTWVPPAQASCPLQAGGCEEVMKQRFVELCLGDKARFLQRQFVAKIFLRFPERETRGGG